MVARLFIEYPKKNRAARKMVKQGRPGSGNGASLRCSLSVFLPEQPEYNRSDDNAEQPHPVLFQETP